MQGFKEKMVFLIGTSKEVWNHTFLPPRIIHIKMTYNLFFYFLIIHHTKLTLLYDANI